MLTLLARPARRTTSHSLMPSATPPMSWGAPGDWPGRAALGWAEAGVAAGIGALVRSPAMEPTGRSASRSGGAAAGAGGAASAAGTLQRPSAPTISSGATGPRLSWTLLSSMAAVAQLGLANTSMGLENQPPSFWSWNTAVAFLQAATASAAAQTSAILKTTRQRKNDLPWAVYPLVP